MPDALVTVEEAPYNAETPMTALAETVTPPHLVYVRNHFAVPEVNLDGWRLDIGGAVAQPLTLGLPELRGMGSATVSMVLECAGNGRNTMSPQPPGTPWRVGAASTTSFLGVPLFEVLALAGPRSDGTEVLFRGADRGEAEPGRTERYQRSLPISVATTPGPLLAWEMGGEPLTAQHGAPLRLVVPGWYGMASVKWLTGIEVLTKPFHGYYQHERYVYSGEEGLPDDTPVTTVRVRSVIARPNEGETLSAGAVEVAGSAWSGEGAILRVEVSTDDGITWSDAELGRAAGAHASTSWRLRWEATPGSHVLMAKATDDAGNTQPLDPIWNRWGYGNNSVHRVAVTVE